MKDFAEGQTSNQGEENTHSNTRYATAEEKTLLETLRDFKSVSTGWGKNLRALKKLWCVNVFTYFVESKESTFDKKRMEAYKSLKGTKYMEERVVRNVWSKSFGAEKQIVYKWRIQDFSMGFVFA